MTKKKSTKRALISSLLVLAMCFTMLVGTTFAWFTDSVSSGNNRIVAGNLKIGAYYGASYNTSILDAENLFVEPANGIKGLWEPGHVEVASLKVVNEGNLALKYKLVAATANEVVGENANGGAIKLSEILDVAVVESDSAISYADRDAALAAMTAANTTKLGNIAAAQEYSLGVGEAKYVAIIIAMATTVGNEANYKVGTTAPSIDFAVSVLATQDTVEADSFNDQYDANAVLPATASKTVPAGGAATQITAGEITVALPANNENTDNEYKLDVSNTNTEVDAASGETSVSFDATLYLNDTKVTSGDQIYAMTMNIGSGATIASVTHNGNALTEANTGADQTYTYDPVSGDLTIYTKTFSPFEINFVGPAAQIGDTKYATLADAYAAALAAGAGTTTEIKLLRDEIGGGLGSDGDAQISYVIDFNGHTYTCGTPAVGSTGTKTQGFRVINGQTVTLKNGTLTSEGSDVLMLVHVYGDLTLDNMVVDGSNIPGSGRYTISYCKGESVIKDTTVKVNTNGKAFDVDGGYSGGGEVKVTVESGKFYGIVEYTHGSRDSAHLYINGGNFADATITFAGVSAADANIKVLVGAEPIFAEDYGFGSYFEATGQGAQGGIPNPPAFP